MIYLQQKSEVAREMKLPTTCNGQWSEDVMNVREGRAGFATTALGPRRAETMTRRVAAEYDMRRIYTGMLRRAPLPVWRSSLE